jgi:hypothetical protein
LEATGLARTKLTALVNCESLRHDLVGDLLTAMKAQTKPVRPALLGVLGKEHLEKRFTDLGCDMETFDYKKATDIDENNIPVVLETAFAWRGEDCDDERRLITGVNWSPGISNPFRELGRSYGDGLNALLERQRAGSDEPVIFLLHAACPRVQYTDRGKSAVVVE